MHDYNQLIAGDTVILGDGTVAATAHSRSTVVSRQIGGERSAEIGHGDSTMKSRSVVRRRVGGGHTAGYVRGDGDGTKKKRTEQAASRLGRAALLRSRPIFVRRAKRAKCCTACIYIKHGGRYQSPFY